MPATILLDMGDVMSVFDRQLVRRHRDRAAAAFADHDFLFREVATRLMDRLRDIKRTFPAVLDLGCRTGILGRQLTDAGHGTPTQCDLSFEMARRAAGSTVVADEEALPFRDDAFDLVLSNLSLHWVNDLPGALLQLQRSLRPDGFFLASMLGGETLAALRDCLLRAEAELTGGASLRVSPFAELRDAAGLLQRAGFALPVADRDRIVVTYDNPFKLLSDIRGMGETNATLERPRRFTRRAVLFRALELYQSELAAPDGRIEAAFDVIFLHGWAPHESQQQPLKPGSATARLATALQTEEIPAGEKADPAASRTEDP